MSNQNQNKVFDSLDMQSPDLVSENIAKIQALFPNCVTEAEDGLKIDFDLLKQELSKDIVDGRKERYRLEWPGKRESLLMANTPTNKTLRPIREDSVDFDNTENVYIEGDNLEVLKLLQGSYHGKVKMIYIDPPYNTGKDFVYSDKFAQDKSEYEEESGQVDEEGNRLFLNKESNGRFHSDWLSMIYPRLKLAKNLLTQDGLVFISIDDNEIDNLIKVCNEIYGEQNLISILVWEKKKKGTFLSNSITNMKEYVLVVSKDINSFNGLIGEINADTTTYPCINASNKREIRTIEPGIQSKYRESDYFLPKGSKISVNTMDLILHSDLVIKENTLAERLIIEGNWRYSNDMMTKFSLDKEIYITQDLYLRRIVTEPRSKTLKDLLPRVGSDKDADFKSINTNNLFKDGWGSNEDGEKEIRELFENVPVMDYPKPKKLIAKLIASSRFKEGVFLDFFSGSGTSAHSILELNANNDINWKYIQVQLPEKTDPKSEAYKAGYHNICEIGKERIRRAATKIKEETGADIDYGFRVYRLDESNMNNVYYLPQDYEQGNVQGLANNIKMDRSAEDLLTQIILDWGLPLSLPIEQAEIGGKKVYKVAGDSLFACFDPDINESFAEAVAEYKPHRLVFKDNSFSSNNAKINMKQVLMQLCPETEVKVI